RRVDLDAEKIVLRLGRGDLGRGVSLAEADLDDQRCGPSEVLREARGVERALALVGQAPAVAQRLVGQTLPAGEVAAPPREAADVRMRRRLRRGAHERGAAGAMSPLVGDDGAAEYGFFGIRPARKASRPASTALRIAPAIRTGSRAAATAVFISTPAQPSSIAIAASEAVPTPASTMIGTFACSMISCRFHGLRMPMPEPISDASGMTATQPISSRRFAWIGSSLA